MREIDQLLKELSLEERDLEQIEELPVTEEELADIRICIEEKLKYEQLRKVIGNEGVTGIEKIASLEKGGNLTEIPKKRGRHRRWIVPLVATLALGGSLIAQVAGGNISELFSVVFGEGTAHIGESGMTVGMSDTKEGMTLNVQGLVGDNQRVVILFDITKEGNEGFQGNDIKFGKLSFEVEEQKRLVGWNPFKLFTSVSSSSSYGWGLIDEQYQLSNQLTWKLEATLEQNLIGGKGCLKIEDMIESQSGNWISEVDLVAFLEAYPGYLSQMSIPLPEEFNHSSTEEELQYEGFNEEEIQEMLAQVPKKALPEGNLNLNLYPEFDEDWVVDNIGFIDGKLHIRMKGIGDRHYTPSFKDQQGEEVEMTYNITTFSSREDGVGTSKGYYVYAIKDLEALDAVTLSTWYTKELKKTEGVWEVRFKMEMKQQEISLVPQVEIPWINEHVLTIEEVKLSNLSLKMTYQGDDMRHTPKVSVKFTDGTEQEVFRQASSFAGMKAECTYAFDVPIDVSQVESIVVNEVEIPVADKNES